MGSSLIEICFCGDPNTRRQLHVRGNRWLARRFVAQHAPPRLDFRLPFPLAQLLDSELRIGGVDGLTVITAHPDAVPRRGAFLRRHHLIVTRATGRSCADVGRRADIDFAFTV